MRILLFFDLPTITTEHQKAYRGFVKSIKKEGFYMLQESVYVKMAINNQIAEGTLNRIKGIMPKEGSIMTLTITEKQFASMNVFIGEKNSDIINTIDRVVKL